MCSNMKPLPLINFSNLKQETPTWESAKIQVREALEEYGCFEATLDHIPLHLQKSVVDAMQQLFDLPLETKLRNKSDKPHLNYIGQEASAPLYEGLGVEDVLAPRKFDAFVNLLWPQGNPTFSKCVHFFLEQLHELEKTVRRMILEIFGVEKYMDEQMESTDYTVRFQKYDAPRSHGTELGLKPHTDKTLVTILYQNVRGLQVEAKNGHWITAGSTSPNSFLVIIGDAFHMSSFQNSKQVVNAWTNGRVRATNHRVMMSGDETRYSVALFAVPIPGYVIKAPEEMMDEDHPLLFRPFEIHQFLDFCYTDPGRITSATAL